MAPGRKEDNLSDGQAKLSTTTREARACDKRRATLRQALREISHDDPRLAALHNANRASSSLPSQTRRIAVGTPRRTFGRIQFSLRARIVPRPIIGGFSQPRLDTVLV